MSVFVHAQGIKTVHAGEGVKKWQNSVHVVVECPPTTAPIHVKILTCNQTFSFLRRNYFFTKRLSIDGFPVPLLITLP